MPPKAVRSGGAAPASGGRPSAVARPAVAPSGAAAAASAAPVRRVPTAATGAPPRPPPDEDVALITAPPGPPAGAAFAGAGGVSTALAFQLAQQRALRCDYVLVKVPPPAAPGAPPAKPSLCPLKLNHHAFMQLAFASLRDRCADPARRRPEDVVALHSFLSRYLLGMALHQARARHDGAAAAAPSAHHHPPGRGRASGRGGAGRGSGAAGDGTGGVAMAATAATAVPADVRPLMTAEELRLQLRAEYGVDALDVAVQHAAAVARGERRPGAGPPLPHELTEEEFMAQMSRPAGMAQECCVS